MGHKGWRKDGKTFIRCYTIALNFWNAFNANFVLLYLSSYSQIKMWHLYLRNVGFSTMLRCYKFNFIVCPSQSLPKKNFPHVIFYEINLSFLLKPFLNTVKKSPQESVCLKNQKKYRLLSLSWCAASSRPIQLNPKNETYFM